MRSYLVRTRPVTGTPWKGQRSGERKPLSRAASVRRCGMKGAREECLTLVQPEGGPSQGRATHMPRQCRRKGTRREFMEGVGAQWDLPGAVARTDQSHALGFFLNPCRGAMGIAGRCGA